MNIEQVRCFVILSETLSFSHTAEILNLTQPAITHQIKKLESDLKFSLFIRSKHGVVLTAAGKVFYPEAKDIITRLQMAIEKASSLDKDITSVIHLGYEGHDIEKYNLPNIINVFKENNPSARVMVFKADHKERKNALLNKKYDLIMTVKDNIENTEGVIYKNILSAGLDCVISENHRLNKNEIITLDDIKNENIILFDPLQGPKELNYIQSQLLKDLPSAKFLFSDSEFSAAIMIKSHEGIAIMPSFCKQFGSGLIHIPFALDETLSYGVAYLKEHANKQIPYLARIIQDVFVKKI
ncbi:LysR family transcriptional regulator [Pectobacterium actinidiae]|uniref:LysR family transcriptional regulator n=1 Tax=Pectobacterium actinidiae TaxID=1507808 RepID=UPI0023AB11A4|nr:LysR family transcriptional regulator [Pectobacterium actinidiae]WEF12448.1 LysR family transcriptional regulator [Pectobacterium actinidiae]GKW16800.1 LysR family transcriptional regulator [Pectobacterium carotovorum subsp. carotovorum]